MLAVGVNHQTAPLMIREKVAFQGSQLDAALNDLKYSLCPKEVAIVSTCNRTELYCPGNLEIGSVVGWWQRYLEIHQDVLSPHVYVLRDEAAVQHMMRVASGLDSMVLGETQILGQLKCAYQLAEKLGMIGKSLSRLFQHSFHVAKKVRTCTDISKHTYSVSYLALKLAKQIYADIKKTTILFIGAGENIELALKHFAKDPVQKIYIANRSTEKAQRLAQTYDAKVLSLSQIEQCLETVDIIISSTNSSEYLLKKEDFTPYLKKRKGKRLFIVDLAVPRDIDPALSQLEEVFLYNMDDLQKMIQENQTFRKNAVKGAEAIIQTEAGEFMDWLHHQSEINNINQYLKNIDEHKNHSLTIARNRLRSGLSPENVLERLANDLSHKLAHVPILSIKESKLIKEVLEEIQ